LFWRFVRLACHKLAVGQQPGPVGVGFQIAIFTANSAKRRLTYPDALSLTILDTVFGALGNVFSVILIENGRKLNENAAHWSRGIHFTIWCRQDQSDLVALHFFNQVTYAPALAMHSCQVVGNQCDNIVISQPFLQRQPARPVLDLSSRLVPISVNVPLWFPAVFLADPFDV